MQVSSLICPFSTIEIDKNVSRISAFLTSALLGIYAYTGSILLLAIVLFDFSVRVFTVNTRPPLGHVACLIGRVFRLGRKPTNKGPKIFAWRIGFLFAVSAFVLYFVNPVASVIVALILLGFSLLDAAFSFCVACILYTYITLPLINAHRESRLDSSSENA